MSEVEKTIQELKTKVARLEGDLNLTRKAAEYNRDKHFRETELIKDSFHNFEVEIVRVIATINAKLQGIAIVATTAGSVIGFIANKVF